MVKSVTSKGIVTHNLTLLSLAVFKQFERAKKTAKL